VKTAKFLDIKKRLCHPTKVIILSSAIVFIFVLSITNSLAVGPLDFFNKLTFGLGGENADKIFFNAVGWAAGFAGFVAGVFALKGGAMYLTAGEDEGKIKAAMATIKGALTGLVVIILAGVIIRFVINLVSGGF